MKVWISATVTEGRMSAARKVMTQRVRTETQYGADPRDRQGAGEGCRILDNGHVWFIGSEFCAKVRFSFMDSEALNLAD